MPAPMVSHDQKSHVALHFDLHWPKEYNGAIDDMIGTMWHWYQHQWHHMTINIMLHIISVVWTKEMLWCHFCCWHYVTLMPVPMLHLILIVLTEGMRWCHWQHHWHHLISGVVPMVSHGQTSHITPHFDYFDQRNTIVPLMVLSISHDADTNAMTLHVGNTNSSGIM